MKSVRLEIELTFGKDLPPQHADNQEGLDWFFRALHNAAEGLTLHSDKLGAAIGKVTVLRVISE